MSLIYKEMRRFIHNIEFDQAPTDTIAIGDDLILFSFKDNPSLNIPFEPRKLAHAVIVICTSGECRLKINLREFDVKSAQLITLLPGQILEPMGHSEDLDGYAIALSQRFIDTLNLPSWQRQYMDLYNNPVTDIDDDNLSTAHLFFAILYRTASNTENPFRLQAIENLIRVFYYGGISHFNKCERTNNPTKSNIVERFIDLVQRHYREERLINFYADKLCLTPKYLSKLIKTHTGRSATSWIESHVILEARALLQNSSMNIQQIAVELNFPNQSFFGKYFKRATGLSPKQYRKSKGIDA